MALRGALIAATLLFVLGGVVFSASVADERVMEITAKKWEFSPGRIVLHRGIPVVLELRSLDRKHGFSAPELGIRVDVTPEKPTRVRLVPSKLGTFAVHCDIFCGEGHDEMTAEIVVVP
jgi:cytochrome c oxidase subunit II